MAVICKRGFAAAGVALALACACGGDEPEPKRKVHEIPLKSVYATFIQEGVTHVRESVNGEAAECFLQLESDVQSGASNLFVVRGETIGEAVEATHRVLLRGGTADSPAAAKRQHWLVVYLGSSPSSKLWQIRYARRSGRVVRLAAAYPERDVSTKDYHVFLAWVPLGTLEDGAFRLEFYEGEDDEPSLVRRVVVKDRDL